MKKRVFVDMDGVLCDFRKGITDNILAPANLNEEKFPQSRLGFFILLEPIEGAIDAVNKLREKYDVWILTRPSFYNLHCYTEKAIWVRKHLGYEMQKKLILSGDKSLLIGDYLIDDTDKDGQDKFVGKLMLFGSEKYRKWENVLQELL
jgi:5'(3')-deoxyribonucleotidase